MCHISIEMDAPELITADEIARHFGVTVPTVNRWVRKGLIPYVRVSRKVVRFNMSEVQSALSCDPTRKAPDPPPATGPATGDGRAA